MIPNCTEFSNSSESIQFLLLCFCLGLFGRKTAQVKPLISEFNYRTTTPTPSDNKKRYWVEYPSVCARCYTRWFTDLLLLTSLGSRYCNYYSLLTAEKPRFQEIKELVLGLVNYCQSQHLNSGPADFEHFCPQPQGCMVSLEQDG